MDLITPLWHCVRNPSQGRPHLRSHGDSDGTLPHSMRTVHSYEPYPPTGFVPRTSSGSQHDLSHGSSLSRRSRRSYQAPQLGLCGWNPTPPSPSLQGTILGTTDAIHHLGSITTSFTPSVSAEGNPGSLLIADGNREVWALHPAWNELGPPPLFPAPSAGYDGSSSVHQADIQSSTTQVQVEPPLHAGIPITIPHRTANATATPSDVENTIQETDKDFCGHTLTHLPVSADWLQPFKEWLPTQRQKMMAIPGLGDPVLCRAVWVRVFGEWLQIRRLLPSQCFGDLAALPWNDVFDFWLQQLLKPDTQGLDASHASVHVHVPSSTGSSVFSNSPPATSHAPDVHPSYPTPSSRKARKRDPNAVSKLTVPEIEEACRKNGAEESVIARIAIVFPIPDLVTREHLKLAGQPGSSAGDQKDHQGYMEFAERCMVSLKNVKKRTRGTGASQVQRYHCKLCGAIKRPRWKNSKDLLDHVWDTHCNPQCDVE